MPPLVTPWVPEIHLKPRKCGGKLQRGTLRWATFVWVAGGETYRLEWDPWVFRCQTRAWNSIWDLRSFQALVKLYREKTTWNFRIHLCPNSHYIVFWWKNPWMKIPHDTENNPPTGHLGLGVVAKLRLATPSAIWSFHHHQLSGAKSGLVGESSAGRSVGTPALPRGIFAVPNGGPNRRSFWGAMFGVSVFHRCYGKVR